MNGGQRIVLASLGLMVFLATVRSVSTKPGLPAPSLYVGAGVLFSFWYLLAGVAPNLAATLAIGTDVAALLRPYMPGGSGNSPLTQLAGLIDSVSGTPAPTTQDTAAQAGG